MTAPSWYKPPDHQDDLSSVNLLTCSSGLLSPLALHLLNSSYSTLSDIIDILDQLLPARHRRRVKYSKPRLQGFYGCDAQSNGNALNVSSTTLYINLSQRERCVSLERKCRIDAAGVTSRHCASAQRNLLVLKVV